MSVKRRKRKKRVETIILDVDQLLEKEANGELDEEEEEVVFPHEIPPALPEGVPPFEHRETYLMPEDERLILHEKTNQFIQEEEERSEKINALDFSKPIHHKPSFTAPLTPDLVPIVVQKTISWSLIVVISLIVCYVLILGLQAIMPSELVFKQFIFE